MIGPQLEALASSNPAVRVRKIDVVSWDSAVSKQHGIRSLPHLVLFKGTEQVASGMEDVVLRLHRM